jgi:hypothetical protein
MTTPVEPSTFLLLITSSWPRCLSVIVSSPARCHTGMPNLELGTLQTTSIPQAPPGFLESPLLSASGMERPRVPCLGHSLHIFTFLGDSESAFPLRSGNLIQVYKGNDLSWSDMDLFPPNVTSMGTGQLSSGQVSILSLRARE